MAFTTIIVEFSFWYRQVLFAAPQISPLPSCLVNLRIRIVLEGLRGEVGIDRRATHNAAVHSITSSVRATASGAR